MEDNKRLLECPAMGLLKQHVWCLLFLVGSYISGSSSGGDGFLLLVLYLLLTLLLQLFSLFVTLLVGPLSYLHCVFSGSPRYSLIFLVLSCSMFTMMLFISVFLFCLFCHIILFSPFILRRVTRRMVFLGFLKTYKGLT